MEEKVLIAKITYGDVIVERYINETDINRVVSINESINDSIMIHEKTILPPVQKSKRTRAIKIKPIKLPKIKQKKLKPLSKIHPDIQRLMRQQLSERREILKDYSVSWEDWCKNNYDVDSNK